MASPPVIVIHPAPEARRIVNRMVRSIDRKRMRELVGGGAQLVEVLPEDEFKWLHIPGALNIPIKELGRRAPIELDRNRPVVVYCHDYL